MSKFTKFALALSCFLPLFFIFGIENLSATISAFSSIDDMVIWKELLSQNCAFYFNAVLFVIWLIVFVIGTCGIICFRKTFLKCKKLSKETVIITKAENITSEYYFTYFSLFVISFFGVDPTQLKDVLIFAFIMFLIIWVYIANDMYFVNPVLNILGYKSFAIIYHKYSPENNAKETELKTFEIKVFTKEPLNRKTTEKFFVTFSPHDFSVCYAIQNKKISHKSKNK